MCAHRGPSPAADSLNPLPALSPRRGTHFQTLVAAGRAAAAEAGHNRCSVMPNCRNRLEPSTAALIKSVGSCPLPVAMVAMVAKGERGWQSPASPEGRTSIGSGAAKTAGRIRRFRC